MSAVPVITIDGPSGTGKGTIAARVAEALGWHTLDSGALYRVLGLAATRAGVALDDAESDPRPTRSTMPIGLPIARVATPPRAIRATVA